MFAKIKNPADPMPETLATVILGVLANATEGLRECKVQTIITESKKFKASLKSSKLSETQKKSLMRQFENGCEACYVKSMNVIFNRQKSYAESMNAFTVAKVISEILGYEPTLEPIERKLSDKVTKTVPVDIDTALSELSLKLAGRIANLTSYTLCILSVSSEDLKIKIEEEHKARKLRQTESPAINTAEQIVMLRSKDTVARTVEDKIVETGLKINRTVANRILGQDADAMLRGSVRAGIYGAAKRLPFAFRAYLLSHPSRHL